MKDRRHRELVDTAKVILEYYVTRRRVGHTELLLRGMHNTKKGILLTINEAHAKHVVLPNRAFSIEDPQRLQERLRGNNNPLALDNCVVEELFRALLLDAEYERRTIEDLEHRLDTIEKIAHRVRKGI